MSFFSQNRDKLLVFAGGLLFGTYGLKALKSKKARKIYVHTLAKGMQMKQDGESYFATILEDAEDMVCEARHMCNEKENEGDPAAKEPTE